MNNTNLIHETALIHPNVKIGSYNRIGKNVVIDLIGNSEEIEVVIGDNNIINDNTRILVYSKLSIGDWNVFHNDMLLIATDEMVIGHNCWFGQNTVLDATGGLYIGNGVRVGMYSQIWTHVASGEQIEGCTLFAKRRTIIEDEVWLVGSCVVGSGLTLGRRTIALTNSVLTKDTEPNKVYAGSPAKLMEKAKFYINVSLEEKLNMMKIWVDEFCKEEQEIQVLKTDKKIELQNKHDKIFITIEEKTEEEGGFFLIDKTYNKSNSELERKFYKFIYNNKARFIPN